MVCHGNLQHIKEQIDSTLRSEMFVHQLTTMRVEIDYRLLREYKNTQVSNIHSINTLEGLVEQLAFN